MPNDGIHAWSSTNWYCAPAGSNVDGQQRPRRPAPTSDTASAAYFARCRAAEGSRMTTRADHRDGPQDGQPRHVGHQTLTARIAATTSAAPPSIDRA